MKKLLKTLVFFLIASLLFVILSHDFIVAAFTAITELNPEIFKNFWIAISDFKPVQNRINYSVINIGLFQTLLLFWTAAIVEEWGYRGSVFFLSLFGTSNRSRGYWAFVWITLLAPTYVWATDHNYPLLYQAIIFLGGLINGLGIVYFSDNARGKALGMMLAIFLHGFANTFYLFLFHYFM